MARDTYLQEQTEDLARFKRDTRDHRMTILQDAGVFRHIRVRNPRSIAYSFNVTTVPGRLVFTGDMGSFVFARLPDMFEFHRINWDHKTPTIDYHYWAQKVEAADKHVGLEDFDADHFKATALREFWNHAWPDARTRRGAWEREIRDCIERDYRDSHDAITAMMEVSYPLGYQHEHPFSEFYEYGPFTKPGFHFRWVCWAIAATIHDYDRGGDRFARQERHDARVLGGTEDQPHD